jgi:hypothetical protein
MPLDFLEDLKGSANLNIANQHILGNTALV